MITGPEGSVYDGGIFNLEIDFPPSTLPGARAPTGRGRRARACIPRSDRACPRPPAAFSLAPRRSARRAGAQEVLTKSTTQTSDDGAARRSARSATRPSRATGADAKSPVRERRARPRARARARAPPPPAERSARARARRRSRASRRRRARGDPTPAPPPLLPCSDVLTSVIALSGAERDNRFERRSAAEKATANRVREEARRGSPSLQLTLP